MVYVPSNELVNIGEARNRVIQAKELVRKARYAWLNFLLTY